MAKLKLIVKHRPPNMKRWQDCQWKRQACGKDSCPICGRIKRDREAHLKKGEDPDSWESILSDVSSNFKEMIGLLQRDAKKLGIDLDKLGADKEPASPLPSDFPLYNKIMDWRQGIYDIAEASSDEVSDSWLYTEAGEDLMWYINTLAVKVFRQLNTIYQIENNNDGYVDIDYNYTGYVIGIVLDILDQALLELSTNGNVQANKFNIARLSFSLIKRSIIEN